jgi:hypothetical protein
MTRSTKLELAAMEKEKEELTSEESPLHLECPEPHLRPDPTTFVIFGLPASQAGTLSPLHDQQPTVVALRGEIQGPRPFSGITDVVIFNGE